MKMQMHRNLEEYHAVLFDMDGTLYYQPPLRRTMAVRLACYYVLRFWRIKDLLIIKKFREERERMVTECHEEDPDQYLYRLVGEKYKVPAYRVESVIGRWMYRFPLPYLKKFRDHELYDLVKYLRKHKITVGIYSDYPVQDKLEALGIVADYCFAATDPQMQCLKPDPRGMKVILNELGLPAEEVLMIGDRYEKDGQSAESAGVDYVILPAQPKKRHEVLMQIKRSRQ
ncbi:HAD family hydrolase [Diplocloster agilis]|nr:MULTISPECIES: HAD family hydrolase [Lachnospiraceae]MCU6735203.1 HAD family hydrolase [Suonthocola fibrivorans]SCJ67050.1 phosphoglycolate phosphatase [uncultured Clostridium sp.]